MSDDEIYMDDDEDYGFDYEDEGSEEGDSDLENKYYHAKGLKEDGPEVALKAFQDVVDSEPEKGDWGFKALKQMTKINFHKGNHAAALGTYKQLLTYTKSSVTRNYSEKSINNILDYVSNSTNVDMQFMEEFYSVTKEALEEARNERLSVKTNLKLAKLWLDRKEYGRLNKILRDLHAYCRTEDGEDDQSKGTILLEIFALEIQMYGEMKDYKRLKETYNQTLQVKSAIPHPKIMGVIRECGGKMHMGEKEWSKAQVDFFESFRNYDEAGSPQRIQVLKYLVLANMLMASDINPFDSQETKPYKNDPEIAAMTSLVQAYQRREVHEAERVLRENRSTIMDDPFIRTYIDDVLRTLRTQYLIDLIKPYERMELSFLARHLNVMVAEVEDLLISLILNGHVKGRIDQIHQRLELDRGHSLNSRRYTALSRWTSAMAQLQSVVVQKV